MKSSTTEWKTLEAFEEPLLFNSLESDDFEETVFLLVVELFYPGAVGYTPAGYRFLRLSRRSLWVSPSG